MSTGRSRDRRTARRGRAHRRRSTRATGARAPRGAGSGRVEDPQVVHRPVLACRSAAAKGSPEAGRRNTVAAMGPRRGGLGGARTGLGSRALRSAVRSAPTGSPRGTAARTVRCRRGTPGNGPRGRDGRAARRGAGRRPDHCRGCARSRLRPRPGPPSPTPAHRGIRGRAVRRHRVAPVRVGEVHDDRRAAVAAPVAGWKSPCTTVSGRPQSTSRCQRSVSLRTGRPPAGSAPRPPVRRGGVHRVARTGVRQSRSPAGRFAERAAWAATKRFIAAVAVPGEAPQQSSPVRVP